MASLPPSLMSAGFFLKLKKNSKKIFFSLMVGPLNGFPKSGILFSYRYTGMLDMNGIPLKSLPVLNWIWSGKPQVIYTTLKTIKTRNFTKTQLNNLVLFFNKVGEHVFKLIINIFQKLNLYIFHIFTTFVRSLRLELWKN